MWNEFKKFILRGNVIDLAVAVIVGGAFNKIVTSLVNDIVMPPIGLLFAKVDFANLFIDLSGKGYKSLAEAQQAGAPTINYGIFLNNVINFLIVGFVVFLLIRSVNRLQAIALPSETSEAKKTKDCPYCGMSIPIQAKRCPYCTSEIGN
ncbi:MAG: large conductance mechanosensitive channel protein MscL [Anaerolineales bacterium]